MRDAPWVLIRTKAGLLQVEPNVLVHACNERAMTINRLHCECAGRGERSKCATPVFARTLLVIFLDLRLSSK
jgi:hypothetical protein